MSRAKLFELGAQLLWPMFRRFVRLAPRCKRCILSERYTRLEQGLCRECREGPAVAPDAPAAAADMHRRLDETIRSELGKGRYQALLLLSGGKDSAYILHRLRVEYPELSILAVIVDNGFMSPLAIPNAMHVAKKLGVDVLLVRSQVPEFHRTIRTAFLELKGRGTYGVVDFADGNLIFDIGKKLAVEMNIPLLVGGLSWVQVQRILKHDDFVFAEPSGLRSVHPLFVWRTDEQDIRAYVRERGLASKGADSPLQSNNELIIAMAVIDVLNNGFSSFEPEFAQLVREGKTDRARWLHVFEQLEFAVPRGLLDRDVERSLAQLGLTLRDVIGEGP